MPPWPSLVAGAIRSWMLAEARVDLRQFAEGVRLEDPRLDTALGSPDDPGAFRIATFVLGRSAQGQSEARRAEPCLPLPADVIVTAPDTERLADANATYLIPAELPLKASSELPKAPVLQAATPSKPTSGLWLTEKGWRAYLAGETLTGEHLLRSSSLWQSDLRLGIALDEKRTAANGMLYTAEAVALCEGIGFLVSVAGADGLLPDSGLLRLGGDGRSAAIHRVEAELPQADWDRIERERRFRMILTTPGIFGDGWRLPGCTPDDWWQGNSDMRARLIAATVSRAGVVSGWDLAKRRPKTAQRVVPTGSVYWLEGLEGETEELRKVDAEGLWACIKENEIDAGRRAEGFNNVQIAAWPQS